MRRRYSLFYFIGQGFQGIFRNGVMSFASVAVLMSCLLVLGAFTLLVQNINVNLEQVGLLNEIVVFVDRDADEEKIRQVEAEIRSLDNVASVTRTTKAEALEIMKAQSPEYAHLYEDIDESNNPLTDKFTIVYEDNERVVTLAYLLGQIDGVRKVNNSLELAATISNLKNGVLLVFTWFLVILFVVSLFVIINTVKLSVFSRRNEISIMRYVGATGWFITLPFLIEGIIIGLVSSVAAYFAELYFYQYIQRIVLSDLDMITLIPAESLQMPLLWAFLAIGVISGVIGSAISLGKYLKA
ncbi:MAG: permease-like cell division protein FtsX [Clostridia bacterium]|nr:permease-like cell division protein FtsX [Clostridia bacterium]